MTDTKDPRTLFAAERTLLAWNRTSLSLIAFGFALERAGLLIQGANANAAHITLTFWLGVSFAVLGAFTSAYSARQFAVALRAVSPADFLPAYSTRWGMVVNGIVAALGVFTALAVIIGHAL